MELEVQMGLVMCSEILLYLVPLILMWGLLINPHYFESQSGQFAKQKAPLLCTLLMRINLTISSKASTFKPVKYIG